MTERIEAAESLELRTREDVVRVRRRVREWAAELGFSATDQTRAMTAASELARNTVVHGRGGTAVIEIVHRDGRVGIRLRFVDEGPGIQDQEEAFGDGFSSGKGLGLGLGGARRMADEMEVRSEGGFGTRVTWLRWKR